MLNMIGTMEFIKCAGSLMTSEYPLLTADSDIDETYIVMKYDNVHFIEDMKQIMTMPSFDGWSGCNMVRFKESGTDTPWIAYYWITDAARSSTAQGCTDFMLEFNAPTTLLKKGDKLNGQWLRSPVNFTPWKQQNVVSGTMGFTSKRYELSNMNDHTGGIGNECYWVSITATKTPDNVQGSLEIYGFPAILDGAVFHDGGNLISTTVDGSSAVFPMISDLINGGILENLGLTASEIQDIAITKGCPFPCYMDTSVSYPGNFRIGPNTSRYVDPVYIKYNNGTEDVNSKRVMYNITSYGIGASYFVPFQNTITITLTDMEATCGQFNIVDSNGSCVANIPSNWIVNNKLKISTEVIVDFSQIYWRIAIVHPTSNITLGIFQINDTHLPYIGSQWDNYRAYSMSADREAMQFGIDQAKNQALANIADSAISTVVGLATGGASFAAGTAVRTAAGAGAATMNAANVAYQQQQMGTVSQGAKGIIGSIYGYTQIEKSANFNQELTERRVQAQPSNGYNINYGLGYVINTNETTTALVISMPVGITESIFNEFVENFGYANEGEYEMPMDYGFYQGTIYTTPDMTGPRLVELINAMNAGIRMIKPSGNTKG